MKASCGVDAFRPSQANKDGGVFSTKRSVPPKSCMSQDKAGED